MYKYYHEALIEEILNTIHKQVQLFNLFMKLQNTLNLATKRKAELPFQNVLQTKCQ